MIRVFCDKLTTEEDKSWFEEEANRALDKATKAGNDPKAMNSVKSGDKGKQLQQTASSASTVREVGCCVVGCRVVGLLLVVLLGCCVAVLVVWL